MASLTTPAPPASSQSSPPLPEDSPLEAVLTVENLHKSFVTRSRTIQALRGVSFTVYRGEVFGLLGPNGSGKSTTLNIISHLLTADSGTVRLLERSPGEPGYAEGAAFVSGDAQFLWTSTGLEILEFYQMVYGASRETLVALMKRFDIYDRRSREWPQYSNGEKTRIRLIRALLASPEFILLDEPSVGLDPDAAREFRDLMKDLQSQGTTILLTSHYMEDVELLADRVCFIHKGVVESIGAPCSFRAPKEYVDIEFQEVLTALPSHAERLTDRVIRVPLDSLSQALTLGKVRKLTTLEESLEDYFINLAREGSAHGTHS